MSASLPKGLKVTGSTSANLDNANSAANGYKAPFIPGSQVVQVVTTEAMGFVRVYVPSTDGRGQAGSWMMRADDIAGLTPTQIASKFGLPQVPTMMTDVAIPAGTTMKVSAANGILPWDSKGHYTGGNGGGGGVQFQLTAKIPDASYTNARPLK